MFTDDGGDDYNKVISGDIEIGACWSWPRLVSSEALGYRRHCCLCYCDYYNYDYYFYYYYHYCLPVHASGCASIVDLVLAPLMM